MRTRLRDRCRPVLLALVTVLASVGGTIAQEVQLVGRGDPEIDRLLSAFLLGRYTLITRDTLLASTDTLAGPVLAVRATLRIEGVIQGDLVSIDSNIFLRPPARVHGGVTNIAGGFYPSAQATVAGPVLDLPNAPYEVVRTATSVRIVGLHRRSLVVYEGIRGVRVPRYDRVDGLTLGLGAGYYPPQVGLLEPIVRGRVGYHSQRGALSGAAEVGLIGGRNTFRVGIERTTETNERWMRGDLINTVSFLFLGKDYRNYYRADRVYSAFDRAVVLGSSTLTASATAQVEEGRSLRAGDPWSLLGADTIRPNPSIDDGRTTSALAALRVETERPTFRSAVAAQIEVAGKVLGGDFDFARFDVSGTWAMLALANHTLQIEWHLRGPLPGTDVLPGQRWSFVGGGASLYTFEIGEFRGDRLVFVRTDYLIPLPDAWRLPVLGAPAFDLLHRAGMAWSHQADRDLEQNVGVRLRFPLVWARLVTNPAAATDELTFSVGLTFPRSYPWATRDDDLR